MKSFIRKFKAQNSFFPKSLTIANEEIKDKKSIAEIFNSFSCKYWYKSGS